VLHLLAEVQRPLLEGMEVATEVGDQEALDDLLETEQAMGEYSARCRSAQVGGLRLVWCSGHDCWTLMG
jgi:hypothetical protein